jgi:hypothetical protein
VKAPLDVCLFRTNISDALGVQLRAAGDFSSVSVPSFTLREPVNTWVSSELSPNIVEPLNSCVVIFVTEDDTI